MAKIAAKTKKRNTAKPAAKRAVRTRSQKPKKNVEMGFWDGGTFRPIRASGDYDPTRAGESDNSARGISSRGGYRLLRASKALRERVAKNPALVKVAKKGKGWVVMVGSQPIGKPGTKAAALRRATSLKATAKKTAKPAKKNCASPKTAMGSKPNPSPYEKAVRAKFVNFLKLRGYDAMAKDVRAGADLEKAIKTIYGLEPAPVKAKLKVLLQLISKPKKNPSTAEISKCKKVLAAWERELDAHIKTIPIIRNPAKAAAPKKRKPAAPKKGKTAAKVAKEFLKTFDVDRDSELDKRDIKILAKNPVQKDLNEFRLAVRRLANKSATKKDIRAALAAAKRAGIDRHKAWDLVKKAWNASAKKAPKRNPGIISALAEIAVGVSAALDIKSRLAGKKKKRKAAKRIARPVVRNTSQKKKRPVRNSAAFEAFQGRPSTKALEVTLPAGSPAKVWCLGKLWELRVKGYGNLELDRGRFYLVADHQNRQLYIAGGRIVDPQPHLAGSTLPLGEITHVVYETEKAHLGDAPGDPTPYIHRMGEEGGERPVLAVDDQGYGHIEGGDYEITPLGIKN